MMIAVDAVLLPPPDVMEKAVEINRRLAESADNNDIILDKETCLPHITLAMGCLMEDDLRRIDDILRGIAASFPPVRLKTIRLKGEEASMRIEKSRDIELLHEIVMIRLSPFFSYKVTEDMLYGGHEEEINEITFDYIRKFPTRSSFENYVPHITVGRSNAGIEIAPFDLVSGNLALCHLGNFCTCRKVLLSYDLSEKKSG